MATIHLLGRTSPYATFGGFTTFSAYMLDTLTLVEAGQVGTAALNVAAQVVLGYALAFAGYRLGL